MHDKSRPAHESKKPGKTLKQKRAAKRLQHTPRQDSTIPPRTPHTSG